MDGGSKAGPPVFAQDVATVEASLQSDRERGLSTTEAATRLKRFGPNKLHRRKPASVLTILFHQFASVIVWLLAAAAAISLFLGETAECVAISVVLVLNGGLGFVTELRAASSMEALLRMAQVRTRVRRAGRDRMIDAREVVPGDVIVLEAGDIVTADLRLFASSGLAADESVLTGEALPIEKTTQPVAQDSRIDDRRCMAFKGTAITRGTGKGFAVATGMETELGRISDLAFSAKDALPPLERRLDELGQRLLLMALALSAFTVAAGILQGQDIIMMIQTGVALAIAAVPEGLPVVATLSLARGMWRMNAQNALVTRLSSVETLGATTVILTDKTGTLTENRMTAQVFLLDGDEIEVQAKRGAVRFRIHGQATDPGADDRLLWALRIGALCNSAHLGDGDHHSHAGDPMELALLRVAQQGGLEDAALHAGFPKVQDHAFDPERKMMATVHRHGSGHLYAVKGAAESVLGLCDHVHGPDGERALTAEERQSWTARTASAAKSGLRMLALAMKQSAASDEDPYRQLTLLGLVGLDDPLRHDVPAAIAKCHRAGVRVVMLTGDHAETAMAIATRAGLGDGAPLLADSRDVDAFGAEAPEDGLVTRLLSADVFARVSPETKLWLVAAFQRAGHVVAMTGDGVNDTPALRKADIGIAMGERGTEVAKEAADMILRDDRFSTIVEAMRQGRVIYENIRKFVIYLMSCNVSEGLVVALAVGGGLPTPLHPLQILYLNLVTDVFPAFALGLGKGDAGAMHRPPRDPEEPVIDRTRWHMILVLGVLITASTLLAFGLSLFWLRLGADASVTVAFLTLALAQLWNVFNLRGADSGLFRNEITRNPHVWGAIAICLLLIGLALWHPALANLLQLAVPVHQGLALAFAASLAPLILGQIWIAIRPARPAHKFPRR